MWWSWLIRMSPGQLRRLSPVLERWITPHGVPSRGWLQSGLFGQRGSEDPRSAGGCLTSQAPNRERPNGQGEKG